MAKETKQELANLDDILKDLTEEQRAEILQMTGQAQNVKFDKTPTLKINGEHKADVNGNKIEIGNWVLGQVIKTGQDKKKIIENIGVDCGPDPDIIIYKVGRQYSYWNDDKNKRCNSNIVCEPGDKPFGQGALSYQCNAKENGCPRRAKDCAKGDRCPAQQVVFATVNGQPCMLYVKGDSYMPFSEYLDSFGTMPYFAFHTKLTKEEASKGATEYFILRPTRGAQMNAIEFKENVEMAREIAKNVKEFQAQRKAQLGQKQLGYNNGADGVWEAPSEKPTEDDITF